GASHFAKRAQLVQELDQFGRVLASDPDMKIHFPAKARAKAWNDALGFDKLDLYKPFGAVEEAVEMNEHQTAANQLIDQTKIAGVTDAEGQARAAQAAGQLA